MHALSRRTNLSDRNNGKFKDNNNCFKSVIHNVKSKCKRWTLGLIFMIILCFMFYFRDIIFEIPTNSLLKGEFSIHELFEMNKIKQQIKVGENFVKTSGDMLCKNDSYVRDLYNYSFKSTFLTLLSDSWNLNYLRGVLVWIYQIKKLHTIPYKIPISVAIDKKTLTDYGNNNIIKIFKFLGATNIITLNETLHNENAAKKAWQNIYTKLLLFDPDLMSPFVQIAYFDADCYPLQPMYELFTIPCNYLLGACNDLHEYDSMNAGFLVIRPNKMIYNTLISLYNLRINYYNSDTSEQAMLNELFAYNGRNNVYNTYWYKFPYEYNTPWWEKKIHYNRDGGYRAQKNIHNRIWRIQKKHIVRDDQKDWQNTWNIVWQLLGKNHLTNNIINLNKCDDENLWNSDGVCTKDMVT
eukprot:152497_1